MDSFWGLGLELQAAETAELLQLISSVGILQPASVDGHRIYVPVLVEGDGVLRGDQRLSVVIRSGLKYREQVIYLSCDSDQKPIYDATKHFTEYVCV